LCDKIRIMSGVPRLRADRSPTVPQVDALLAASRVLVALSVRSLADVEQLVTLTQLRALVVIAANGAANLSALADAMGVHASNASRTAEQLVVHRLLARAEDPTDRRHVVLDLTPRGRRVVQAVLNRRRELVTELLVTVGDADREALIAPLRAVVAAAGDVPALDIWSAG